MIVLQQPSKESLTPNAFDIRFLTRANFGRSLRGRLGHGPILQAAMRPMLVVEADIFLADVIQMATTKTGEMVQAFALVAADPRFHEGVRARGRAGRRGCTLCRRPEPIPKDAKKSRAS